MELCRVYADAGPKSDLTLKELGMAVCDSFLEDCERKHTADTATLSLLDLIEKMTRKHS